MSRRVFPLLRKFIQQLHFRRDALLRKTFVLTLTVGVLAGQATPYALAQASSDPRLNRPVLAQSNFTYLGSFKLPQAANNWDTA